jgi:hypothetical protein
LQAEPLRQQTGPQDRPGQWFETSRSRNFKKGESGFSTVYLTAARWPPG